MHAHPFACLATLVLLLPHAALATPPTAHLDERGLALVRAAHLPSRTYAWSTWLVGDDDTQVVVSEGDDPERPARLQAFDNRGTLRWSADHACPDFQDYATLFALDGRLVCKLNRQILAVDLATGKEAWRFTGGGPLYITAGAQGRVAVSIDNAEVAVLDVRDGRELMRVDVGGAVLEAVAATPRGPLALLVKDTPGRAKETVALGIGPGAAPVEVELAGEDPGRQLVALPIGGPAQAGVVPMQPLWAAPFEGYSFELEPTAGVVVGMPRDGVRAAWDLATGALLWERPQIEGELLVFGEDGAAFARRNDRGEYVFGAMDPRTMRSLWQMPLPPGDTPLAAGQGGGDLGLLTTGGLVLVRYRDGALRHSLRVEDGVELPSIRSTPTSLAWVTQRDAERRVYLRQLQPL